MLPAEEHRQDLDGLAQTHVVSKAATQPHLLQEDQPAEAFLLVLPQDALEAFGFGLRLWPLPAGEFLANPFKALVYTNARLAGEQGVEQGGLHAAIPQPPILLLGQGDQWFELAGPVVGQNAHRSVGEFDGPVTAGNRLQQRGHLHCHAAKVERS